MPKTRVIHIPPSSDLTDPIAQAVQTLESGGLLAFPTETVYAVAARADLPQALQKLRHLKHRPDSKPFTVHIGRRDDAQRFVPHLPSLAKRLIAKAWPGPLTLIFTDIEPHNAPIMADLPPDTASAIYHQGTIGLRCPDDPVALALLTQLEAPIVAASANQADQPPAINAEQVLAALDGQIDLLLDAGPARYARASTIVKLNHTGYQIVRQGVLESRTIDRLATLTILLVCTGNTCRSPMAAAILRQIIAQRLNLDPDALPDHHINVISAGTAAAQGDPAAPAAVQALTGRNLDLTHHRSQCLTVELINQADHIYTMTQNHRLTVQQMSPTASQRVQPIDPSADVADPIGQSVDVYRGCAETLATALQRRISEIPL